MVATAHQYLFTIPPGVACAEQKGDLLFEQSIKMLYSLTITPIGENLTRDNAWVKLEYSDATFEILYLNDGETRVLKNLESVETISKGDNINLDIYALIVPISSSVLDEFILDSSILGASM
jgi:hypothetical protein